MLPFCTHHDGNVMVAFHSNDGDRKAPLLRSTTGSFDERNTLVLRCFGDDATWGELPGSRNLLSDFEKKYVMPESAGKGEVGSPFRGDHFPQLA